MSLNRSIPCEDAITAESKPEIDIRCLQTLQTIPQNHQDLSPFFFLFCISLLHGNLLATCSGTTA
ncbi:hypothetical protein PSY81_23825, partial [Shigella flexneri]|nr:hypothetical protein [Shigella flexneri]